MLQVLVGQTDRVIRESILHKVCSAAKSGKKGQILIVPEQYSHEMEHKLCEFGGDTICLSAEVLSFSRLAHRVCSIYGGVSRKTLDKGGRLIAMSLALEMVGSRLKIYGTSRRKPEFLLRLIEVVEEFKGARVIPEQLRTASEQAEGYLAQKLEELALIQESFDTVCATMGQDTNDRMAQLSALLETSDYAKGRTIYIFAFSDFTGQELEVISNLLQQAETVVVGVLGNGTDDTVPYSLGAEMLRALKTMAAAGGSRIEVQIQQSGAKQSALTHLTKYLYSGAAPEWAQETNMLHLHHSSSIYSACMDIAGRIQALVRDGWHYRDIAVCTTQSAVYEPVLAAVFSRFQIPFYCSGAEPIEGSAVIGMVLAALEAASGHMETEAVLRFLKSELSPLEVHACDRLEIYAYKWKIRGKKWEKQWDMHPDGYGFPIDERTQETLRELNEVRLLAVAPLLRLRDGLARAANTAAQVHALYDFLVDISLAEKLSQFAAECQTEHELQEAQKYAQMYEIIINALEQMHRILGNTVREGDDFARLFRAILSQYTIGTIPATLDCVELGGIAEMRFGETRALLLFGADDGALPSYRVGNGLLSEQERKSLLALGIPVSPGQHFALERELTSIYQVLSTCEDLIYVNYIAEQPSYLLSRIQAMFPRISVAADEEIADIMYTQSETLGELLTMDNPPPSLMQLAEKNTQIRLESEKISARASHRLGALGKAAVQTLYGEKLYLSASRIDKYAACRCAYFLDYGLKLKPVKEISFDAPIYGTFVHAVLEAVTKQVREEGGFHVVSPERLEEIGREKIAGYRDDTLDIVLAESDRQAYLFARNAEEVLHVVRELGRELRTSDFEPAAFELSFSRTGEMEAVEVVGKHASAEVSGFVDRVDIFTKNGVTYTRVVDYKTGKKSFDYTDLENGMGLQMLIYLFALEDKGAAAFGTRLHPAGVLYFPARRPLLPADTKLSPTAAELKREKESVRKGLLLNDETTLRAMEHYEKTPVFMPYKVKSNGELDGDLASNEELRALKLHVTRVLEQTVDAIAEGAVEPNPIMRGSDHSACTYCDYKEVCHQRAGELSERNQRRIKKDEFWEKLRREDACE